MTYLSRDDILKADDLHIEDVEVPEWGGIVRVCGLSGRERADFQISTIQLRGKETIPVLSNLQAKLVARAIVDEDGHRMFTDQDITALGEKSSTTLERVFQVASRLSGLSDDDLETLAGNSEPTENGGSISA